MQRPPSIRPLILDAALLGVAGLLWTACGGGDVTAPATGEIEVTVSTTGAEPDPDGYSLSLDDLDAVEVDANGSRSFTVEEGAHTVELAGLAPNCSADGGMRQRVSVPAGDTLVVEFTVVCTATTGGLQIVTSTSGQQIDPDGYSVRIDDREPQAIEIEGAVTVTDLAAGPHTVGLIGVAGNCTVAGDNPRAATVPPGELGVVEFTVTCSATTGGVTVTTVTSGISPDADGYTVRVDQGEEQPIDPNGSITVAGLEPGTRSVLLDGVAANCTVAGANPRPVEIATGRTASVRFEITCAAVTIRWTPMASGTRADLPEVWGNSGTDVFVIGEVEVPGNFDVASVVLHFDGTGWAPQHRELDVSLRGLWGSAADDVFAVGFGFFTPGPRIMHYDGRTWSEVPEFLAPELQDIALVSVWGSSASDIFAVGAEFNGIFDESVVYHFDGTRWGRLPVAGRVTPGLFDVWGTSGSDVYAVGRDDGFDPAVGAVMHYDGADWSPVLVEEGLTPNSVWASSPSDVFVAGFTLDPRDENAFGVGAIRHFDGTRWSNMTIPTTSVLDEVWGTSASDVFAVGEEGVVLHYDGTAWTATNPTTSTLLGVWGSSSIDVFAVGNGGTILHGTP